MKSPLSLDNVIYWNRKFHIFIGLFLLLFILFFSFSGLLLNHSQWEFASFWKERKESEKVIQVTIPANRDSSALIHDFMNQLNLAGEVRNVKLTSESLNFRVTKPGIMEDLHVDFIKSICIRKETVFNWWGKLRNLHTFNGYDKINPDFKPNWSVTNIWRLTMDSVAIGLIFLSVSSWVMWFKVRKNYPAGLIVLILSIAGALFFIIL